MLRVTRAVWCVPSMWQANEDHWAADSKNVRNQIWGLDDRPTGVSQKQQGELMCLSSLCSAEQFNNLHEAASLLLFRGKRCC